MSAERERGRCEDCAKWRPYALNPYYGRCVVFHTDTYRGYGCNSKRRVPLDAGKERFAAATYRGQP